MTNLHDAWLAKHRARWLRPNARLYMRADAQRLLRPDAKRFLRHDWQRYVQPGFDPLFVHALLEGKANFNPNQPRVPKGSPDGGRWTSEDWDNAGGWAGAGGEEDLTDFSGTQRRPPGIGHNEGPPLDEPPEVPPQRPSTAQETNTFLKAAAQWLARAARAGIPVGAFLTATEASSWLDTDRAFIDAYRDPPKTLEELQQAAPSRKWGYHIHHIVEQTPARTKGMSETLISGPDNLVRIPALKHWQITGWYGRPNKDFGGQSPREYLQDKDWDERRRVGLEALIRYEVLRP
jgi:hypothetical protein